MASPPPDPWLASEASSDPEDHASDPEGHTPEGHTSEGHTSEDSLAQPPTEADDPALRPVARATKKARLASEQHLRAIVVKAMGIANTAAWDDPWFYNHLAPNFVWDTFHSHRETSRDEHIEFMKALTARHPHFHCDVQDIAVEVQEKLGRGKVWCVMNVRGWPQGVEREALHVFFYRRLPNGEWVWARQHGFNGVAPLPLPFAGAPDEEAG